MVNQKTYIPLTGEKIQALEQLVQEKLDAHHIEESIIPWNSPVFVVKTKSGKWRMMTDLRAVNNIIQPMSPLKSGISLPSLLPKEWPLIVIDLKDCFFIFFPYTFSSKGQRKICLHSAYI